MRYSKSGHHLSQVNTADANGVLRLFTDSVEAHVASQAQTAHALGAPSADHTPAVGNMLDGVSPLKDAPASREQGQSAGHTYASPRNNADTSIRCDVELARIAMALHLAALYRLWLICYQILRDTNNQGITRLQLDTALARYGVQGCPAYITRLLHSGAGRFWRIDARGTIFPCGYITLCKRLVQLAAESGLPHLYDHQPGTRRPMYLDVSGSMKAFESHILAAWYECHNDPTVSRFLLQRWFNRSDVTLRKLERRARVQKTYNTAETLEPSAIPLDAQGELRFHRQRKNRRGQTVYSFQLPNTYHVKGVKQHAYRGQGYKAAAVIRQLTDQLTDLCSVGDAASVPGEDNRRGRLYYADYKRVRQARRKGREGVVYSPSRPGGVRHTVWDVWV